MDKNFINAVLLILYSPANAGRLIYASSLRIKPFDTIQLQVHEEENLLYSETAGPTPTASQPDRLANRAPYYQEMEPQKFNAMLFTLRREPEQKTRMELASQIMADRYFTTSQVME